MLEYPRVSCQDNSRGQVLLSSDFLPVSDRKRLSTVIVPNVPVALTASCEVSWLLCKLCHVQGRQMYGDVSDIHSQNCMFKCTEIRPYFPIPLPFLQL